MRRSLFAFVFLLVPTVLFAADRNQSYVTFDDGASTIRQASDDRDIAVRLNLPIYPGDELRTSRRGRTEVRLADGNVVAVDRNSILRFQSIFDSLEGDNSSTVLILEQGQAIFHRLERSKSTIRIDTDGASYVSTAGAIYSVEAERGGSDMLAVYEGSVEVRTPAGTSRVRSGEQTKVDARGVYAGNDLLRGGSSDFERWYLKRAERHGRGSSRYLDRSLSYADYELNDHGSWIYVSDYGWTWRPRVSSGWRPYHYGSWSHTPSGRLHWVSDEPWGWVPYHYGRWAFSPSYGWVWVPGSGYSHAWVYWLYGPSYLGWIPAGYYDLYGRYSNHLYTPYYARAGFDAGFGFYGRVRVHDIDFRHWTFLNSNQIISTRVDRAAVTADVVRARLTRDNPAITVSNIQARFGRNEIGNPGSVIEAVARRGLGGGTGTEGVGLEPDASAFIRRDPALSTSVLERIGRPNRGSGSAPAAPRAVAGGAGAPTPRDGAITIDRSRPSRSGESGTGDKGRSAPAIARPGDATPAGIDRGREPGTTTTPEPAVERGRASRTREDAPSNDWRERTNARPAGPSTTAPAPQNPTRQPATPSRDWRSSDGSAPRSRGVARPGSGDGSKKPSEPARNEDQPSVSAPRARVGRPERTAPEATAPEKTDGSWRSRSSREGDDTPRRVIDQIGGARVTTRKYEGSEPAPRARSSRPSDSSSGTERSTAPRSESSRRESSAPRVERSEPRVERSEPRSETPRSEAPQSSPPPSESSAPRARDNDSGSNIKPD